MVTVSRSNPTCFKVLADHLRELDGKVGRAGWLEPDNYENGLSVAAAAAQNEFGGIIQHPGGTPYKIGADGKAIFVSKENGDGLPVTKPHTIVIPPRPFMRPTIAREKNNWKKTMADGARAVLNGNYTATQVMEAVALQAAGNIKETISQVTSPPLKSSTIRARVRQKDKNVVGALDKPLIHTGKMIGGVMGRAENA